MQRILSTYLLVSKKFTPELIGQIRAARFDAIEIFASRSHYDYTDKSELRTIASSLLDNRLKLNSLHAPTSRDLRANREGGSPLSITEVERVRRIEAMDELKRVIDSAEELPFSRMIVHMGGSREIADPRKRDAAFSSLEHLVLCAHHAGVTICLENTTSEMGEPHYLKSFVEETRLTGLRFNFDIGHAHLGEGPEADRVRNAFEPLRDLVASAHIHDNHADKDDHLLPYDGSIDWPAAIPLLKTAPPQNALPLTLELKEHLGPDAPSIPDQLSSAAKSLDRLESLWRG